jgi:hypothetical protein
MVLLLLIPAWILIFLLVAGLCVAAHAGDELRQTAQPATAARDLSPSVAVSPSSANDADAQLELHGSVARSAA